MAEVDVGLFDFDFDTTFSLFVLNGEKNVYLRYGARTDVSAEAFLSEKSLQLALERGLTLHKEWKDGKLDLPVPRELMAQSFPNVKQVVKKGQCVHCHQVADGKAQKLIAMPDFNKKTMPWVYPDPANLGLQIDPDDGVVLRTTTGVAAAAGIKTGDRLQQIGGKRVSTFADVQHALHNLPLDAKTVSVTTAKGTRKISLPENWRVTNINRRSIGHRMTPFPEFWGKHLEAAEKRKLGLEEDGFATRVTKFWTNTNGKRAGLREGDIVIEVDGVKSSPLAQNAMIYIRTHYKTGDEIRVGYLRGKKQATTKIKLRAKPW